MTSEAWSHSSQAQPHSGLPRPHPQGQATIHDLFKMAGGCISDLRPHGFSLVGDCSAARAVSGGW